MPLENKKCFRKVVRDSQKRMLRGSKFQRVGGADTWKEHEPNQRLVLGTWRRLGVEKCVRLHDDLTCLLRPTCDAELRTLGDWSPWLRVNKSRGGHYVTERFRCMCKASVDEVGKLRKPQLRTARRYCSWDKDDHCTTARMASCISACPSVDLSACHCLPLCLVSAASRGQSINQSITVP